MNMSVVQRALAERVVGELGRQVREQARLKGWDIDFAASYDEAQRHLRDGSPALLLRAADGRHLVVQQRDDSYITVREVIDG